MAKIKILLNGCNGHMGRSISELLLKDERAEVLAGIDLDTSTPYSYPVFKSPLDVDPSLDFDVIIDFSHPKAVSAILDYTKSANKPLVLATTGLGEEDRRKYLALSKEVPVFVSANMSLGINVLIKLASLAARQLLGFDLEIVEAHHRRKIDAPSGTALMIAQALKGAAGDEKDFVYERQSRHRARSTDEIGIHSIRGGSIAGDHSVIFAGEDEILEIKHHAASRRVFAAGAIAAAVYIKGKTPGLYSMDDLLQVDDSSH